MTAVARLVAEKKPSNSKKQPVLQRLPDRSNRGAGSPEAGPAKKMGILQRKPAGGGLPTSGVPAIVHEVLGSPGQPLDANTREIFEPRFGMDFSNVRVHTDEKAAESARSVNALAYTVGDHIVFASGQYAPHTPAGTRLTAHELTHVVQQGGETMPGQLQIGEPYGMAETEAEQVAARATTGHSIGAIRPNRSASLRRSPDENQAPVESLGPIGDAVVNQVAGQIAIGDFSKALLAAAITGFIIEMKAQVEAKSHDKELADRLDKMFTLGGGLRLFGGYLGGLVAGIISPLTGLFDLAVLGEQLDTLATNMISSLITGGSKLAEMARAIKGDLVALSMKARAMLRDISIKDLLEAIAGLPGQNNALVRKANGVGHDAAKKAVASFVESTIDKPEESWKDIITQRKEGESYTQPLGLINSMIERSKEKVFSSLPARIGYDVGYAIGFLAINVVLFAFTDGIGNLITEIGTWIGKIAPALTRVAEVLKIIGSAITAVEEAIAVVVKGVLKPLESIMKEFEPLLLRLRAFLRELFGVVEDKAGTAAGAVTKNVASDITNKKPTLVKINEPTKPPVVSSVETHTPPPMTVATTKNLGEGVVVNPKAGPFVKDVPSVSTATPTRTVNEATQVVKPSATSEASNVIDLEAYRAQQLEARKLKATKLRQQQKMVSGTTRQPILASSTDEDIADVMAAEQGRFGGETSFETEDVDAISKSRNPRTYEYDPTIGDSGRLGDNLRAKGFEKPGEGYQAHHMIPSNEEQAEALRDLLRRKRIDINDADNGVWLPTGSQTENLGAEFKHEFTFEWNDEYFDTMNDIFLRKNLTASQIRTRLRQVRWFLSNGRLPPRTL